MLDLRKDLIFSTKLYTLKYIFYSHKHPLFITAIPHPVRTLHMVDRLCEALYRVFRYENN